MQTSQETRIIIPFKYNRIIDVLLGKLSDYILYAERVILDCF